jgi:hypothetical protein
LLGCTVIAAAAACAAKTSDDAGGNGDTTNCPAGQRFFNGRCAATCTKGSDCSGQDVCIGLDEAGGVCQTKIAGLPGGGVKCAYLETDTKCVGTGEYYYYGGRSGGGGWGELPSDPPGASTDGITPYGDETFHTGYGPYYGYNPGGNGCQGDAKYVIVDASTDPACTAPHRVRRCRRLDNSTCALMDGTTGERYVP